MMRIALALKSGLSAEIDWAMRHLVRFSFEAGDGLRLEQIPDLSETLLSKVDSLWIMLHALSLDHPKSPADLDDAEIETVLSTPAAQTQMDKVLEATLVLRNCALQRDNARYLASIPQAKGVLARAMALPQHRELVELKQNIMDVTEAISLYITRQSPLDTFYIHLADLLDNEDRVFLITALRSLSRLAIHDDDHLLLQNIKQSTLNRLILLLTLQDEDLVSACLDFFYQYTSYLNNVGSLLDSPGCTAFFQSLVRLLLHNAQNFQERRPLQQRPGQNTKSVPSGPPDLPPDLITELLNFPEPERSFRWMRVCYKESLDDFVTQVSLWQSYQLRFQPYAQSHPLLKPADVIKNVSVVFSAVVALVEPSPDGQQKFILKGLRPRDSPLTVNGNKFLHCSWTSQQTNWAPCNGLFMDSKDLLRHIMDRHIESTLVSTRPCQWAGCERFKDGEEATRSVTITHLKTHIPHDSDAPSVSNKDSTDVVVHSYRTAVDERGQPVGLALTASLVLRNLSKSRSSIDAFKLIERDLLRIAAINESLNVYVTELLATTL
ncbi:Chromatin structure-remodeling complex subunit rsc9 [Neolecta irregularis DAH-3]|uniref:Chromatin structure-remodeling complex subunit rsc9 n=1 Tax=Neolecta irregularis (strain DAH-3) TaxID=1198029 RepID=A0A1U7LVG8_NEOID|nr:Chromatin structure-remodeling complex subunit rsc9 [Neolecta irregularis DAH-3]|eukprot:OLL26670.1 Chromatin structure-remodeling complex subunit rsc9 [Neolecta irregularis DAH-3]